MHPPATSSTLRSLRTRSSPTAPTKILRQCASIHNSTRARLPLRQIVATPGSPAALRRVPPPNASAVLLSPSASAGVRVFHSHDHPPPPGPFGATEATLLAAAYKHVPEHGFTATALAFGARDAGFPDISTGVLPDGEFGLIRWHLVMQKEVLAARAEELFGEPAKVEGEEEGAPRNTYSIPEKIEMLTWERLMGNKDVIGQWQQALAVMAHPTHVPTSVKLLAQLADEIVYLSGDKAVDPSWYSSRGGVGAIYASTELFMTSDKSEGFVETRQFLRRRMDEARGLKGALSGVGEWIGFNAMGALNVVRSWGAKI